MNKQLHGLIHTLAEQMLSANPSLSALASQAEDTGVDPHEVRHCLGRAFLSLLWHHAHGGSGHSPDALANEFAKELSMVTTGK